MSASTLHANAVLLAECGILIFGASGSGKSALVLALLQTFPATARLVADDRVMVSAKGGRLIAAAPPVIAGLMEVRGSGIVRLPFISPVVIRIAVHLLPLAECPRMPGGEQETVEICGVDLPCLRMPEGMADAHRLSFVLSQRMGKR